MMRITALTNGLVEIDKDGNIQEKKVFQNSLNLTEEVLNLKETSDGGYLAVGQQVNYEEQKHEVYVMKTDSDFEMTWEKHYSLDGTAVAWNLLELEDGSILVGAYAQVDGENYDSWLIKLDSEGEMLWDRTFGGEGVNSAPYFFKTEDGKLFGL